MRVALLGLVSVLGLSAPLVAQVEARQATPEDALKATGGAVAAGEVAIPNPMLLELKLLRKDGASVFQRFAGLQAGAAFPSYSTTETAKFVCDRARVQKVTVFERRAARGKKPTEFEVSARVASEWFRQDIDATLTLIDADGRTVATESWDDETIGNDTGVDFGGRSKDLVLELSELPASELDRLQRETRPLTLKIVVEIQGEPGDPEAK